MNAGLVSSLILSATTLFSSPSVVSDTTNGPEIPVINIEESSQEFQKIDKNDLKEPSRNSNSVPVTVIEKHIIREKKEENKQVVNNNETLTGIDISSHQHTNGSSIDIDKVVEGGEDFAFVKATEGTWYINPYFRQDTIKFIDNKTPIGFYHYARPTSDPDNAREQARLFVRVTGMDQGVKGFPPVLDLEENDDNLSSEQLISWVEAFVDEIKTLTDRDTMIYTYPNYWKEQMGNTTKFSELPLWIASYNDTLKDSHVPGGWDKPVFWQYTSEAHITGAEGKIDRNIFYGNKEQLQELYK